jgi:hypothetical protein
MDCVPRSTIGASPNFQYEAFPTADFSIPRALGTAVQEVTRVVQGSASSDARYAYQTWQRECQRALTDAQARTPGFIAGACDRPRIESTWSGVRYSSSASYLRMQTRGNLPPDGFCGTSQGEDCYTASADCACAGGKECSPVFAGDFLAGRCAGTCGDDTCDPLSENDANCPDDCARGPVTPPDCGSLAPGQQIEHGQHVVSCDGRYSLEMQGDGNLVLYRDVNTPSAKPIWATNTSTGRFAAMQGDGNFVLYDNREPAQPLFASNTADKSGAFLHLQNDGNLIVFWQRRAIWTTGADR